MAINISNNLNLGPEALEQIKGGGITVDGLSKPTPKLAKESHG